MKKYNKMYFKENLPEWKRKKDPIFSRIFYRRISFYTSALCANLGIGANDVSYFNIFIGIIGCLLFLPSHHLFHIIGAIFINIWLLLDCTDGNLARSVKKEPFGEFADSISSYIIVGLMNSMIGIAVYFEGGLIFNAYNPWIILLGALASSSDTLMRLIYQKYKNTERKLADSGIVEIEKDDRTDINKVNDIKVRIESDLGIGGILPMLILICAIFKKLDLVVLYCLCYYGLSFVVVSFIYIKKAINKAKKFDNKL